MTIQAVVFDIGGVLQLTPRLDLVARWREEFGLTEPVYLELTNPIWTAGSIGELSIGEVHERLGQVLGIDESTVDALMSDVWTEYLGSLNTELYEYLRGLRPRYRTGLLSNSFAGAREKEQLTYRFEDLVDDIVYSHEVGLAKPDPAVYALTCERHGVDPSELLFLDDVPAFVDGARAYGIQAVLYRDNAQAIADVEARLAA
jgi:epoxide hydrolase-like predicted phosphatase